MKRNVYLLQRGKGSPPAEAVDRIGGVPPGVPDEGWPHFGGRPMIHLLTLDVRGRGLSTKNGVSAVSVFVDSLLALDAFGPGDGGTRVVFLTNDDLTDDIARPDDAELVTEAALEVEEFGQLVIGPDSVAMRWASDIEAEDIDLEVEQAPEEAAAELLAELLEDEGHSVSYAGGYAFNPSTGVFEEEGVGDFLMRLSEPLFGPDRPNFAGGGFLFVFEDDAWAEQ